MWWVFGGVCWVCVVCEETVLFGVGRNAKEGSTREYIQAGNN